MKMKVHQHSFPKESAERYEKRYMSIHILFFHHPSGNEVKVQIAINFVNAFLKEQLQHGD